MVARSTVPLISSSACSGTTSPRCADCTCALSTASGVRSWWALSRTKRFWWSSRRCSRPMTWVVASISGRSSRGASGASMGERSSAWRFSIASPSSRTGRVARCTTNTVTSAITPISSSWRHSVSMSSLRASVSRISSVSATCTTAMPRPVALATGCRSTATRTGWLRNCAS